MFTNEFPTFLSLPAIPEMREDAMLELLDRWQRAGVFTLAHNSQITELDGTPLPCWQGDHVCWEVRYATR